MNMKKLRDSRHDSLFIFLLQTKYINGNVNIIKKISF